MVVGVDDPGRRPAERLSGLRAAGRLAAELLEQRELGVAVGLPRPVELEVLVGEVGQDRDVVADAADAVEREAVRRGLDDGRRSPAAAIARSARLQARAPPASWRAPRWRSCTPPIRVAAVPVIPVRMPAASSAADARNEVVVLPSVPVIPTTASSRLGSPYHHAARRPRAAGWLRPTMSCGSATSGSGRSTMAAAAPASAARRHEVVAVDVGAGDRHEQRARPDLARIVGDAADLDGGEAARADRAAIAAARRAAGRQP